MSLRLHKRAQMVNEAQRDLETQVDVWGRRHTLTDVELQLVVLNVLSARLRSMLRMDLRMERHGTYDKKADEA